MVYVDLFSSCVFSEPQTLMVSCLSELCSQMTLRHFKLNGVKAELFNFFSKAIPFPIFSVCPWMKLTGHVGVVLPSLPLNQTLKSLPHTLSPKSIPSYTSCRSSDLCHIDNWIASCLALHHQAQSPLICLPLTTSVVPLIIKSHTCTCLKPFDDCQPKDKIQRILEKNNNNS